MLVKVVDDLIRTDSDANEEIPFDENLRGLFAESDKREEEGADLVVWLTQNAGDHSFEIRSFYTLAELFNNTSFWLSLIFDATNGKVSVPVSYATLSV